MNVKESYLTYQHPLHFPRGSPVPFMIPKWNHKKTGTYIILKIRIPGIQASNNLGNLGQACTFRAWLHARAHPGRSWLRAHPGRAWLTTHPGKTCFAHNLGELGYVHTLGWESLAAVTLENFVQNYTIRLRTQLTRQMNFSITKFLIVIEFIQLI